MAQEGIITNIQRCSTEDGPGIRTTVFLKGCPLHCVWCQNPETIQKDFQLVWYEQKCIGDGACVAACPETALNLTLEGIHINHDICRLCGTCVEVCPTTALRMFGETWEVSSLVDELLKDKVFFETSNGGVTLSGGEALSQIDFAVDLARSLKNKQVHVALDTCGYYSHETLERILPFIDLVLYDIKIFDSERHKLHTGGELSRILDNAVIISNHEIPIWIRTPVIPGYTNSRENIKKIAEFIVDNLPTVERFDLLAFNRMCVEKYALFGLDYPLEDTELVSQKTMEELVEIARKIGVNKVRWSGMTLRDSSQSQKPKEVKTCGT